MLTADEIAAWDPTTASRGRAYARGGRVTALRDRRGVVEAEVEGSEVYRVRVAAATDDYACDCPVGVTGALCKHVVAVLVVAADAAGLPVAAPAAQADVVADWLDTLGPEAVRALLDRALDEVEGVDDLVTREYVTRSGDVTRLLEEIREVLTPRRSFYEYRAANDYVADAERMVDVMTDLAERSPTTDLLRAVERGLELVVRATLRSDDSAGGHGMLVDRLLALHADLANTRGVMLGRKDQRRLATWLFRFRFAGTQDFFDPDVDRYADGLGPDGVREYRALVDRAAADGKDEYAVQYARRRLAILDRDVDEIVRQHGGPDDPRQVIALHVSEALDEAGFPDAALAHARRGLALPRSHQHGSLVARAVAGALAASDVEEAVRLRAEHLEADPSATTYDALRAQAREAGVWDRHEVTVEGTLRRRNPSGLLSVLLADARDDEAWQIATVEPDAARHLWPRLCERRARTHPAETLPYYRDMVLDTLRTTGAQHYATAARQLVAMRAAAAAADLPDEFARFMAEVAEANRRRPTCIDRFVRAGLITADRTVVRAAP